MNYAAERLSGVEDKVEDLDKIKCVCVCVCKERNIQEMWDTIKKKTKPQIIGIDEEKTPRSMAYARFSTRSQKKTSPKLRKTYPSRYRKHTEEYQQTRSEKAFHS